MKYSFQEVPTLTNSPPPLFTTGHSTGINQKVEENLWFTSISAVQFSFLTSRWVKQKQKKASNAGVSFNIALKQEH